MKPKIGEFFVNVGQFANSWLGSGQKKNALPK